MWKKAHKGVTSLALSLLVRGGWGKLLAREHNLTGTCSRTDRVMGGFLNYLALL